MSTRRDRLRKTLYEEYAGSATQSAQRVRLTDIEHAVLAALRQANTLSEPEISKALNRRSCTIALNRLWAESIVVRIPAIHQQPELWRLAR